MRIIERSFHIFLIFQLYYQTKRISLSVVFQTVEENLNTRHIIARKRHEKFTVLDCVKK